MNVKYSDKSKQLYMAHLMHPVQSIYLFFDTVSIVMDLCTLMKLLVYAPSVSQWSHDATVSIIMGRRRNNRQMEIKVKSNENAHNAGINGKRMQKKIINKVNHAFPIKIGKHFPVRRCAFSITFAKNLYMSYR
ncbi:MAG: hypothetical protein ACT6FG_06115 [Methanosarcinaceae archaeon]